MMKVGIRELRQHLSLRGSGKECEVVEVTEHGRLVARIAPATERVSEIAALERIGLVVRLASLSFDTLVSPESVQAGARFPSELLADDRADERL